MRLPSGNHLKASTPGAKELRRVVLLALLLALGDEGDLLIGGRPGGLAVLLAATRQAPHGTAEGGEQPQARVGLVLAHRKTADGANRLRAVGREREAANAFELPEFVDGEELLLVGHRGLLLGSGQGMPLAPCRR